MLGLIKPLQLVWKFVSNWRTWLALAIDGRASMQQFTTANWLSSLFDWWRL